MKTLKLLVLATVLAASPACKKKKTEVVTPPVTEPGSASGAMATPDAPDMAGSGSGMAGSGSGSAADPNAGSAGSGSAAAARDPKADFISVLAEHAEKKPTDPVEVSFDKFAVKKATFDPKKVEGGTATIEVDLASL